MSTTFRASVVTLLALLLVLSVWRRTDVSKPPPQGFGVAIGYGLGGAQELDALGNMWYLDYDFRSTAIPNHQRFLLVGTHTDLNAVPAVAQEYPGEWWQFGNEPNDPNQDNVTPAEYAIHYHQFYDKLKTADPTARIVSAGIADADWKWADSFREAYRAQFSQYPPMDGWNIHNYLLDRCEDALDVNAFKSRILAFREWMTRIGDSPKPLFLTEYGVLYGNGCCRCPIIPPEQVVEYMRSTNQWLAETKWVQGWAWFAIRTGGRFNGDLFDDQSSLTEFGRTYRDLIRETERVR